MLGAGFGVLRIHDGAVDALAQGLQLPLHLPVRLLHALGLGLGLGLELEYFFRACDPGIELWLTVL